MSKVKFIQLSATSKSQYDKKISEAKLSYPGAIIFVTYTDDTDNNKQKQEIWANGLKYEVGGGGTGNVIYGDIPVNANGQVVLEEDAEGNPTEVQSGEEGSIYIYKGLTSQTAYYWSTDKKWKPFNIDAENVWFHGDITMAGDYTQIGNLKKPNQTNSLVSQLGVNGTNFSLKTLMDKMFSQEKFNTAEWNYIFSATLGAPTITISNTSGGLFGDWAIVGTNVTKTSNYKTLSSSCTQSASIAPTFGYYLGEGTSKQTGTKSISGSPKPNNVENKQTITGNNTIVAGANTYSCTVTGQTYTLDKTVTDPQVKPLSNLGKVGSVISLDTEQWGQGNTDTVTATSSATKTITGVYEVFFEGRSLWPNTHSGNLTSQQSKPETTPFKKTGEAGTPAVIKVPQTFGQKLQIYINGQWFEHTDYTVTTQTINSITYNVITPSSANGFESTYRVTK